jgi:hypothetical protein
MLTRNGDSGHQATYVGHNIVRPQNVQVARNTSRLFRALVSVSPSRSGRRDLSLVLDSQPA